MDRHRGGEEAIERLENCRRQQTEISQRRDREAFRPVPRSGRAADQMDLVLLGVNFP